MKITSRMALVCACALLIVAPRLDAQGARTIYLVRHADKVSDEADALLSDAGHRRAECLAATLADAHIDKIYVSDLHRTQQTAAPLAKKLHLTPVAMPLSKPPELIDALRAEKAANVLVVWHGSTLPGILRALGGPEVPPIAETEYDRFFILTLADDRNHPDARFTALRYCDCAK